MSLVAIAFLAYHVDGDVGVLIAMAMLGGLLGFLRYNTHPAVVFMGDNGSQAIGFSLGAQRSLRLALRNPDLTTARRIALSINDFIGSPAATPEDPATIRINLPYGFNGNIVDLLTDIEQLVVQTDLPAKIVIDENSGIIVMGQDVRVSTVAVAQSNLTVTIAESPTVVQPEPLSLGQTAIEPRTDLAVQTSDSNLAVVPESVTLQELVDGLNALGISPRDLIAILQAIKASGALQAEIEVL